MNKKSACKINDLKYPTADNISSRTSTLCRSMACTLLIRESCTAEKEKEWMTFFPKKTCAYCGRPATHLDHLYALIIDRKPTGYGTEPGNLVPCCGSCNQPKGNMHWEDFMRSDKCKHVGSLKNADPIKAMEERIDIIKNFQIKTEAKRVFIDASLMSEWENTLSNLDKALIDTQKLLLDMKEKLYMSSLKPAQIQSANATSTASKTSKAAQNTRFTKMKTVYEFNGIEYVSGKRGKSPRNLLLAIVNAYFDDHPNVTYEDLIKIFDLKLNFGKKHIIRLLSDLTPNDMSTPRVFISEQKTLSDGNIVVVNNQVSESDMPGILLIAQNLGYNVIQK